MNVVTQTYSSWPPLSKGFRCYYCRHCFISLTKIRKKSCEPVNSTHFSIKISFTKGITCRLAAAQAACNCLLWIVLASQGVFFTFQSTLEGIWIYNLPLTTFMILFLEKNLLSGFHTFFSVHYQKLKWQQLGLNLRPSDYEEQALPTDQSWLAPTVCWI